MTTLTLTADQRRQLQQQLRALSDARTYRRTLARLDVAAGQSVTAVAQRLRVTPRAIYNWLASYAQHHDPPSLTGPATVWMTGTADADAPGPAVPVAGPLAPSVAGPLAYRGWHVALLADEDPSHTAKGSIRLADELGIELLWLPKRCPELNPMDTLWGQGKDVVCADKQYADLDEQVGRFVHYLEGLSPWDALHTAGVLSEHFWLRHVL
jgi:hypothetical protein